MAKRGAWETVKLQGEHVVEHRHDLSLLGRGDPMDWVATRSPVGEARTAASTATPPLQAPARQLQIATRLSGGPTGAFGALHEFDERNLGGLVKPGGDAATHPQGSFPSASVNFTAIPANAIRSRSTSARASSSS